MKRVRSGPVFSILLPTHDRPDVIEYSIRSVLAQTFDAFELLVVGDGVSDETRKIIFQMDDPRIRFFDLPKGPGFGYGNNNVALREARGELVAFAADDDLYFPDHLERMLSPFNRRGAMLAHSRSVWIWDDGVVTPIFTKAPSVNVESGIPFGVEL